MNALTQTEQNSRHTPGPISADEARQQALRDGIRDMLEECTEAQRAFLHRIHDNAPWKGLANCPPGKLAESYELVRRTVFGNRAAIAKAEGRP
jgi:hypothetical protein